jgi:hypothetical protein
LVKEFGKQTELMDSQLHLIEQQKTTLQATPNAEPDHSLALKVADQIIAIERSIGLMDEKTKGLQRIKNSITNLKDNLSANGYEMPELIGKSFNQGMKIIVASSIPDENLKKGEEIITRIVKPQVNFNDKMIQAAQVASLFTLFTHHAKTFPDLVFALRNSLLKAGVFSQEKMAEQQDYWSFVGII